jgi:hypothetical protein
MNARLFIFTTLPGSAAAFRLGDEVYARDTRQTWRVRRNAADNGLEFAQVLHGEMFRTVTFVVTPGAVGSHAVDVSVRVRDLAGGLVPNAIVSGSITPPGNTTTAISKPSSTDGALLGSRAGASGGPADFHVQTDASGNALFRATVGAGAGAAKVWAYSDPRVAVDSPTATVTYPAES